VPTTGSPIRSQTRMLKIWFAPYEDDEGALRDQSFLYVMVDSGRWEVEHNKASIMKQFGPIKAPRASAPAVSGAATPSQEARSLVPGAGGDATANEEGK
jgi:conjugal transfer pilus assembly protein TraV